MQPKLFKTTLADYVQAEWNGKNESGWKPAGDRVLVLPDSAAELIGSIAIPGEIVGRLTLSAETGTVVAVGEGAFKWNSDKATPYVGQIPKPGDRVYIERYSGQIIHGHDTKRYRLMESACIGAIKEEANV